MRLAAICLCLIATSFIATSFYLKQERTVKPWPGQELRIVDESERPAVDRAIAKINQTGINLKLVRVQDSGDVTIRTTSPQEVQKRCRSKDCVGHASYIGYRGKKEDILLDRRYSDNYNVETLVIHELGHILGLKHSERAPCRMMDGDAILTDCRSELGWYRCGLQGAEVRELARLYGRQGQYSPWCKRAGASEDRPPTIITASGKEKSIWQPKRDSLANSDCIRQSSESAYGSCPSLSRKFNR